MDRSLYSSLTFAYLKRAVPGWIFFMISFCLVIAIWRKDWIPPALKIKDRALMGGAAACYLLSVLLHLQAFGQGAIALLKTVSEKERKILEG